MIKLHHAAHTRSDRVRWLLEELSLPYEIVPKTFTAAVLRSPEHRKLHPLGQLPVIEDGGLVLFESGAILQHIMERYGEGGLLPPLGSDERSRCWQWFHFGEASLARHIGEIVRHRINKPEAERVEAIVVDARGRLLECVRVLDAELADGRQYILAGGFSAADIMLGYGLILARWLHELPDEHRHAVDYVRRLRSRLAYVKASA